MMAPAPAKSRSGTDLDIGPSLALQIAAVEALAQRAAAYAASPAVQTVERLRLPAEAERDALLAAAETLRANSIVRMRAADLLREIDRRVGEPDPVTRYVVPWSQATALRVALHPELADG